MITTKDHSEES